MDTTTPTYIEAAHHVLGYHGIEGGFRAGDFTNFLIGAITRADMHNFALLSSVYPELADAVHLYKNVDNGVAQLQAAARGEKPISAPRVGIDMDEVAGSFSNDWDMYRSLIKADFPDRYDASEFAAKEEAPSVYSNDLGSLFPQLKEVYSADFNVTEVSSTDKTSDVNNEKPTKSADEK